MKRETVAMVALSAGIGLALGGAVPSGADGSTFEASARCDDKYVIVETNAREGDRVLWRKEPYRDGNGAQGGWIVGGWYQGRSIWATDIGGGRAAADYGLRVDIERTRGDVVERVSVTLPTCAPAATLAPTSTTSPSAKLATTAEPDVKISAEPVVVGRCE